VSVYKRTCGPAKCLSLLLVASYGGERLAALAASADGQNQSQETVSLLELGEGSKATLGAIYINLRVRPRITELSLVSRPTEG